MDGRFNVERVGYGNVRDDDDLIRLAIRGRRGAIKGADQVTATYAETYFKRFAVVLGRRVIGRLFGVPLQQALQRLREDRAMDAATYAAVADMIGDTLNALVEEWGGGHAA